MTLRGVGSKLEDRLAATAVRLAAAVPESLQRLIGGRGVTVDGATVHPEVRLALRMMALDPRPPFETLDVDAAREVIAHEARLFGGSPIEMAAVREVRIPGVVGGIPARLYDPGSDGHTGGLLVYFHGGGWVVGDIETHDSTCRFLAAHARSSVLSVDYRRAPEHTFPAAVDDAVAALQFAMVNAADLRVKPNKIAVGGDSAGGNLAAVAAQISTASGTKPAFQLLFYPVTDLSRKHPSYHRFSSGYFLTESQMDWYRGHYLRDERDASDPRVSPLLADDLSGLPPAYLASAGFDPLRDEGELYAARLQEAGVPVVVRRHERLVHGFVNALGIGRSGTEATHEAAVALRMALCLA